MNDAQLEEFVRMAREDQMRRCPWLIKDEEVVEHADEEESQF